MSAIPSTTRAEQRARLIEAAVRMLEASGPEALQARRLTAAVGASTQAVYTLFGGMPDLIEAVVADGFRRFAAHVASVPETDDPVADHFAKGWAYCDWALAQPQLYRLMFGLTAGSLRQHPGLETTLGGFPEGQAAIDVLMRSLDRVKAAGRIRPVDTALAAGQFLSATHGYLLLQIGGAFPDVDGQQVIGPLAMNLMVALGDRRDACEQSLGKVIAARAAAGQAPRSDRVP